MLELLLLELCPELLDELDVLDATVDDDELTLELLLLELFVLLELLDENELLESMS